MTPVDRQTLVRKLEYLRKQLGMLQPYRTFDAEALRSGIPERLIIERLLEVCLQSVIDCSRLLVLLQDWRPAQR